MNSTKFATLAIENTFPLNKTGILDLNDQEHLGLLVAQPIRLHMNEEHPQTDVMSIRSLLLQGNFFC